MSIKYLCLSVSIHGLDIKDKVALSFLKGWIKEETRAGLLGKQKTLFNFRDAFADDIEVDIEEQAGNIETLG
jgi:hypothetical protein